MDTVFNGSTNVDNLYSKALKLSKNNNLNGLKLWIQQIAQIISQQSNKSINPQDIMNILYDSSSALNEIAGLMYIINPQTTTIPAEEIDASYSRLSKSIPACLKNAPETWDPDLVSRSCIKQRISQQYTTIRQNDKDLNSFKTDTFGEDFFSNGTLDDSAYDILIDIENIWNLLFTSFSKPSQTLFYQMPKSLANKNSNWGISNNGWSSNSTNNWSTDGIIWNGTIWNGTVWDWVISNGKSTGDDKSPPIVKLNWSWDITITQWWNYVELWANWTDNVDGDWIINPTSWSVNTAVVWTYVVQYQKTDAAGNISNTVTRSVTVIGWTINDPGLDSFLQTTKKTTTNTQTTTTNNTVNALWLSKWNICIAGITWGNSNTITTATTETDIATIQTYLDKLYDFTSNTTPVTEYTNKKVGSPDSSQTNTTWETASIGIMNQFVEEKMNAIFDQNTVESCINKCGTDTAAKQKSCNDQFTTQNNSCNSMNFVDKTICQNNSRVARDECKDGIRTEDVICKIECACFTIQYPDYWKTIFTGMDGQLKLRFCTVPVQKNLVSKKIEVLGRDDMLTRIKSVFENLLNGWEMVKHTRTKEYLDSPIAGINLSQFISFEIKIFIKSLFTTVPAKAKSDEAKLRTDQIAQNTKNSGTSANTANKFSISDAGIKQRIEDDAALTAQLVTSKESNAALQHSKNLNAIMFNQKMFDFLQQNSTFRYSVEEQLTNFNDLSAIMRGKLTSMQ